ncbi:hypothetical protein ACI68E_003831 [Malassezia pachydermatis]
MAPKGEPTEEESKYDRQDEAYFSYYSMLTHQAQMLQVCTSFVLMTGLCAHLGLPNGHYAAWSEPLR